MAILAGVVGMEIKFLVCFYVSACSSFIFQYFSKRFSLLNSVVNTLGKSYNTLHSENSHFNNSVQTRIISLLFLGKSREAAKKSSFLVVRPLRPLGLRLSGH